MLLDQFLKRNIPFHLGYKIVSKTASIFSNKNCDFLMGVEFLEGVWKILRTLSSGDSPEQ